MAKSSLPSPSKSRRALAPQEAGGRQELDTEKESRTLQLLFPVAWRVHSAIQDLRQEINSVCFVVQLLEASILFCNHSIALQQTQQVVTSPIIHHDGMPARRPKKAPGAESVISARKRK